MKNEIKIPLNAQITDRAHKLFKKLEAKSNMLDTLKKECIEIHDKVWKIIGAAPNVDVDEKIYSFDHTTNMLICHGDKLQEPNADDINNIINEALEKVFGDSVQVIAEKSTKIITQETKVHEGNETKH